MRKFIALLSILALLMSLGTSAALAKKPQAQVRKDPARAPFTDSLPNPLADKQVALKTSAQEAVLLGEATPRGDNKVVKLPSGQFVELARQGEDSGASR